MDKTITQKLDEFFSSFPAHAYRKGEIIIQAHTEPSGIFYIEKGLIRNYWISEGGSEITLNVYKPHAFLPMSWAIANVANAHFYEAMTDVTTRNAPKKTVIDFLHNEPDVTYDLLRRIYVGMEGLWGHLESLTIGSSYTKLLTSLVILVKRFGRQSKEGVIIDLKMSEQDIANYAGISRETTSRELQKLKKEHLVSFEKGTITVNNIHILEDKLLQ